MSEQKSGIAVDLPPTVTLVEGEGGLAALSVKTSVASGEVYLQGAHVTSYVPAGHDPVVWMSSESVFAPGTAIRGGVPICFPWFGAGREPGMKPPHGYARLADWTVVGVSDDDGVVTLTFRLTDEDVTGLPGADVWREPFELTYSVTFGPALALALTVKNSGNQEYSVEEALHAYLHVHDITAVTVEGLEDAGYHDKTTDSPGIRSQSGAVTFSGLTDSVYRSTSSVTVVDPGYNRTLTVDKESSANTVVWNPWTEKAASMPDFGDAEWPTMVCIEVANVLDDAVVLGPGESHTMVARYSAKFRT